MEEYKDVAYMKFVDRAQRRMNGGALLSTRVHAHLCRGNQSHAMHKDTDKLMAVLLKIINTDADTRVRTAAENALAKVRTLFEDDKMMVNALVAYDERANHTQRGAAPSREVCYEMCAPCSTTPLSGNTQRTRRLQSSA